jgi:hypothetical protein
LQIGVSSLVHAFSRDLRLVTAFTCWPNTHLLLRFNPHSPDLIVVRHTQFILVYESSIRVRIQSQSPDLLVVRHTQFILVYESSIRVCIHTANLIHSDWNHKTQVRSLTCWFSSKFFHIIWQMLGSLVASLLVSVSQLVPISLPSEGRIRPSMTQVRLGQNAAVSEYQ